MAEKKSHLQLLAEAIDLAFDEYEKELAAPGSTGHSATWHLARTRAAERLHLTELRLRQRQAAELAKGPSTLPAPTKSVFS